MSSSKKAEKAEKIARRAKGPPPNPPPPADDIVRLSPDQPGFREKATPKKPHAGMFFFECTCKGIHYRHAGYVEVFIPFLKGDGRKEMVKDQRHVMVCVTCRKCFVWLDEQMYDVTDRIDLDAWAKSEVELQRATGPGGDC